MVAILIFIGIAIIIIIIIIIIDSIKSAKSVIMANKIIIINNLKAGVGYL